MGVTWALHAHRCASRAKQRAELELLPTQKAADQRSEPHLLHPNINHQRLLQHRCEAHALLHCHCQTLASHRRPRLRQLPCAFEAPLGRPMLGGEILHLWDDHDPAAVAVHEQGVQGLEQEHRLALGLARERLHDVEEGEHRGQTGEGEQPELQRRFSKQPYDPEGLSAGQHQALRQTSPTPERRPWVCMRSRDTALRLFPANSNFRAN